MFRIVKNDIKDFYFVTSADWEFSCESSSFNEAASTALTSMLNSFKKDLNLSPAIIVVNMSKYCVNFSESHSKVFSTSSVLSDIGMHELAKKIKTIMP